MRTVVIIQARLGSSRLPAKVLLPLPTGRSVIDEVLARCAQITGVDDVIVAIPNKATDDVLADFLWTMTVTEKVVRGPEYNVLARYAKAARESEADVVVRITADCPCLNPKICSEVVEMRKCHNAGYASNAWPARHFPHGWDCEVFTSAALFAAVDNPSNDAYDQEHVGPAIRRVVPAAEQVCLKAMDDRSLERLTLDTLEDYEHIYRHLSESLTEAA